MLNFKGVVVTHKSVVRHGALGGFLMALTACGGGGGGGGSSVAPPAPPIAAATANLSQGTAPLTVSFDASKSTDPQNFSLTYTWTFSDGAAATGISAAHTFQNHGSYTATVAVNDGHNTTTSAPVTITVTPAPPTVQATSLPVNVLGVTPTTASVSVSAVDRESLQLSYSIATQPTVGTASIDAASGAITYIVPGHTTAATDSFTVRVASSGASATGTVAVTLNTDPLLPNQWHIQNTGQNAFSSVLPAAGNDMNVAGAWTAGFTGKGIKVAVVDTGLEAAHEDLAANVDLTHSYNFVTGSSDPSPTAPGEDHGTQVGGIIGAVAFNGKGGRGVAYNATLRGYNLLTAGSGTVSNLANALGGAPVSADNDVFNASFGETGGQAVFDFLGPTLPTFDPAKGQINANTATLRNGLGAALVQAAGNDFRAWANARSTTATACAYANQFGVSCGDPASDTRRASSYPIIVGALNASGTKASYSSSGSSLWIAAPGGEFGWDSTLTAGLTPFPDTAPFVTNPAIVTAARTGCAGYTIYNMLDDLGSNSLAASCQYTAVMNGTSAATPNTVGVIALMLEAKPSLTVRDIKYIFAKTATQVDPTFAGVSTTAILPGATFVLEQGWITNAAGYKFSNWYGFGGINATAAVTMAKGYTTFLPASKQSAGTYAYTPATAVVIPAQSGIYIDFSVSESFTAVEGAIVYFSLASTPGMNCNQIELRSPSGTKSILMHGANGFGNLSVANARLESNAFYGEPLNGTWRLTFWDLCVASGLQTVLPGSVPQSVLFVGH
jgi:subtilisin family serine protease